MHQKLTKMISVGNVCTFTTLDRHGKVNSRRTPTAGIDTEANLWFFTDDANRSRGPVERNFAHLMYSKGDKTSYIRVCGNSISVNNKEKLREFWSPQMKEWFPLGLDDPKLALVKVKTREIDFYNASPNKIAAIFNRLKAFFSGNKSADTENRNLTAPR